MHVMFVFLATSVLQSVILETQPETAPSDQMELELVEEVEQQPQNVCHLTTCTEPGTKRTSDVSVLCQNAGFQLFGRCCLNTTEDTYTLLDAHSGHTVVVIGLDLTNCNLKNIDFLHEVNESFIVNKTTVKVIGQEIQVLQLENNTELLLVNSSFDQQIHLQHLSIPGRYSCPGGDHAWQSTDHLNTSDITECKGELDICDSSLYTCPKNSHCIHHGPGYRLCECVEGWHGYKCLRKGYFSWLVYGVSTGAALVAVTLFLWWNQRRDVKKHT